MRTSPGHKASLESTAAALRDALEGIGFFIIVNHGVPRDLIAQTFAEAKRFHDQPADAKMALRMNEHNNGYMALGRYAVWTSEVNTNTKPDLNEAFFVKRERAPGDPLLESGRRFVGPEPLALESAGIPRERPDVYRRGGRAAGADSSPRAPSPSTCRRIVSTRRSPRASSRSASRTIRPSRRTPISSGSRRTPTPTSSRSWPRPRSPASRCARRPGHGWTCPTCPDSFAVNSGDMMSRWTNGRFKSTPHRALPPIGRHRYAIPFFLGPHVDTVIECLPTCQGPDTPPKYPPITYADYLTWWYDANYDASRQQDRA